MVPHPLQSVHTSGSICFLRPPCGSVASRRCRGPRLNWMCAMILSSFGSVPGSKVSLPCSVNLRLRHDALKGNVLELLHSHPEFRGHFSFDLGDHRSDLRGGRLGLCPIPIDFECAKVLCVLPVVDWISHVSRVVGCLELLRESSRQVHTSIFCPASNARPERCLQRGRIFHRRMYRFLVPP